MGSLAAAIRLASQGFEVEVFEKNDGLGGRMGRLEARGFAFDTGPSLLLMTDTYRELFASAGRDLDDYVRLVPLDGQYRVTFGDGDSLTIRRTLPELIGELERIEPGVTPRFYRFLEDACNKYRLGRSELAEDGLWFPEGGMYSLIEAMERLATELGVRFHLNSPVEEVVVSKGRASGVRVGGEEIGADAVLVGADLPYAYRELLGGSADGDFRFRRREKLEYTASAFMLYLGVYRKLDHLLHHNFYLSGRYRENFEAIFRDGRLPDDPSFYAVVPSRTEPRMAPERMESLFVLVPVPHLGPSVDWGRDGPAFRERVYDLLEERCGVKRKWVAFESVRTPLDWRDEYNLEEGAAFGIGHGILQVGYFRPPMVSKGVGGLYFVGASTRPGTGVPLVTIGARLVAERIGREVGGS